MNNKFFKCINRFEDVIGAILMFIIIALGFVQVVFRYVFHMPLAWTEDYIMFSFVWMIYFGASMCTREGKHVCVDMFMERLPFKTKTIETIIVDILWMVFCIVLFKYGIDLTIMSAERGATTVATKIPLWIGYVSVPAGMVLMFIRLIGKLKSDIMALKKGDE